MKVDRWISRIIGWLVRGRLVLAPEASEAGGGFDQRAVHRNNSLYSSCSQEGPLTADGVQRSAARPPGAFGWDGWASLQGVHLSSNVGDRAANASSAKRLSVQSGWSCGIRVSKLMNPSIVTCGSCSPHTLDVWATSDNLRARRKVRRNAQDPVGGHRVRHGFGYGERAEPGWHLRCCPRTLQTSPSTTSRGPEGAEPRAVGGSRWLVSGTCRATQSGTLNTPVLFTIAYGQPVPVGCSWPDTPSRRRLRLVGSRRQ
jgi:hypothetical protein